MIWRFPPLYLTCIISAISFSAIAQPTLPDITGREDSGIITLSWNCQYSGIKAVNVLRSYDSINYVVIGKVKKLDKGIQEYTDDGPAAGDNYYKLDVVFGTGLKWGSNRFHIYSRYGVAMSKPAIQQKDLSQNNTTTHDTVNPAISKTVKQDNQPDPVNPVTIPTEYEAPFKTNNTDVPKPPIQKTDGSTGQNTSHLSASNYMEDPHTFVSRRKKVDVRYDDAGIDSAALTVSHTIVIDNVTGQVRIELPPDIYIHRYSVKFYNDKGAAIIDIPRINAPSIILDKRNFQRQGTYRFTIRRDVVELESGYITVVPNP